MNRTSQIGNDGVVRSELIEKLAEENPTLTQAEIVKIVNSVFVTIIEQLASGGRVELRGFGSFDLRQREAHVGRNPRTGVPVAVPSKSVPFFKAGKQLRDRLSSENR